HRATASAVTDTTANQRRASVSHMSPATARGRPKANMPGRYGTCSAVPGGQEPSGPDAKDTAYGSWPPSRAAADSSVTRVSDWTWPSNPSRERHHTSSAIGRNAEPTRTAAANPTRARVAAPVFARARANAAIAPTAYETRAILPQWGCSGIRSDRATADATAASAAHSAAAQLRPAPW